MSSAESSFYVTGGTLRPDAPSCVERRADPAASSHFHRSIVASLAGFAGRALLRFSPKEELTPGKQEHFDVVLADV